MSADPEGFLRPLLAGKRDKRNVLGEFDAERSLLNQSTARFTQAINSAQGEKIPLEAAEKLVS